MIEWEATLRLCPDCFVWTHYGSDEPEYYGEGYEGPTDDVVLRCVVAEYDCECDSEVGDCDGHWHFSKYPCEGCGDGLAGDRAAVRVWTMKRKERA